MPRTPVLTLTNWTRSVRCDLNEDKAISVTPTKLFFFISLYLIKCVECFIMLIECLLNVRLNKQDFSCPVLDAVGMCEIQLWPCCPGFLTDWRQHQPGGDPAGSPHHRAHSLGLKPREMGSCHILYTYLITQIRYKEDLVNSPSCRLHTWLACQGHVLERCTLHKASLHNSYCVLKIALSGSTHCSMNSLK